MSRAFTREEDNDMPLAGIGERPVSAHRNLVTPEGLAAIEAEIAALRDQFVTAERAGEKERMAVASRDLRYWAARRETAELSVPDAASDVVRFGMSVALLDEGGKRRRWKIVGEDEADATAGKISHVSPMAVALFGKGVGETIVVNGREFEIITVSL